MSVDDEIEMHINHISDAATANVARLMHAELKRMKQELKQEQAG